MSPLQISPWKRVGVGALAMLAATGKDEASSQELPSYIESCSALPDPTFPSRREP